MSRVHKLGGYDPRKKSRKLYWYNQGEKSKSNHSPLPMTGDSKMAQFMKMMEIMQARMDERKWIMATTLQISIKDPPKVDNKKKEEEGGK